LTKVLNLLRLPVRYTGILTPGESIIKAQEYAANRAEVTVFSQVKNRLRVRGELSRYRQLRGEYFCVARCALRVARCALLGDRRPLLLLSIPDSRFPIPDSRFPIPMPAGRQAAPAGRKLD
jgi:hypothetical protein